jgi:DNA-binding NarL/FixJ family response regulator
VLWGGTRIANLHWSMGDAARANEVLELLQRRVNEPALLLVVEGIASATRTFQNRLEDAAAASQRVLSDPAASPPAIQWAVFGGALAAALMGLPEDAASIVARGRQLEHKMDGLLRCLTAFGEVRGLSLAGHFAAAAARSGDIVQISSPGQYLAWGMANILVGTVEVARGRFASALPRMEETVAALTAESAASWNFPAGLLLAQSYCALGHVESGTKILAELHRRVGGHVAVFEPQLRLAGAWLSAAEGHVSGAISKAIEAADLARDSGQRAVEMLGRLAQIHAAYATALIASDAAELFCAAEQFEAIGALLSAADAAAQAATLFKAGDRRRAIEAAAAAERLAAACGGVKTPALAEASQPLPLSTREREIANFVAQGMGNRDIADRLVVSTRTVEGHIYRACIKLDVSDREGLATVIRQSRGK